MINRYILASLLISCSVHALAASSESKQEKINQLEKSVNKLMEMALETSVDDVARDGSKRLFKQAKYVN